MAEEQNPKNQTKEKRKSHPVFYEIFTQFLEGFLKNFFAPWIDRAKEKMEIIASKIKKVSLAVFLLAAGFIFLLIGLARLFNDLIHISCSGSVGYIVIGFLVLFVGLLISYLNKK